MYRAEDPTVTNCWNAEIGEGTCDCKNCLPVCPHVNHEEDVDSLVRSLVETQSAIIRLKACGIMRPEMVSLRNEARIIKKLLLRVSLKLYDAEFMDYEGPNCTCPPLLAAKALLHKLRDTCIVANVDPSPMWSFLETTPQYEISALY